MKNDSTFKRLASLLTVTEIAEPIAEEFEASLSLKEIYEKIDDGESKQAIFIVTEGGVPQGFLYYPPDFIKENLSKTAGDVMREIDADKIIPIETSILELFPLWSRAYTFFVSDKTKITHFVSRHHMDSQIVKVALFSLTAELEKEILRLFLKDFDKVGELFRKLDTGEQKSAKNITERKMTKELFIDSPYAHIQNTFFSGKTKILLNSPELLAALPFKGSDEAKDYFEAVNTLRNELAHGGSLFNIVRDIVILDDIVSKTEDVLKCLSTINSGR